MAFSRGRHLIVRFTAALTLRFIVALAYATGLNAVIFLPLTQVRAQTLPSASTGKAQGSAEANGLAKAIASPAPPQASAGRAPIS